MRRILSALAIVVVLAAPALAETDSYARNKLNTQAKQIETLQAQVRALTVLVEQQSAKLAALQAKTDANLTLIKGLATTLDPPAPRSSGPKGEP